MRVSGGEVDFKYDHSIYWPALEKLTTERRQQRKERWEKAGKLIGESEMYLWGGEEGSITAGAATQEKDIANGDAAGDANGAAANDGAALVDGVAGLDIKTSEPVKAMA